MPSWKATVTRLPVHLDTEAVIPTEAVPIMVMAMGRTVPESVKGWAKVPQARVTVKEPQAKVTATGLPGRVMARVMVSVGVGVRP